MRPFTFVLAGPISSRFYKGINLQSLIEMCSIIKLIDQKNEIIVSTYPNEIPEELEKLVDLVIIVEDPGADYLRAGPWPIGPKIRRSMSNTTRMYLSSINGIQRATNEVVIKSRVELVPENIEQFRIWYTTAEQEVSEGKIGFFIESYEGINFSISGALGHLPDILQFGTKNTLLRVWEDSLLFWNTNKKILTRRTIRYPLGSEQILGLSYLSYYHDFNIEDKVRKLRKNYFSFKLIQKILRAEKTSYIWTSYKNSGFSVNYFQGLIGIKIPSNILYKSKRDLVRRLILVFLKKIKHHYRRLYVGLVYHLKCLGR
jgi:hypothetical protein